MRSYSSANAVKASETGAEDASAPQIDAPNVDIISKLDAGVRYISERESKRCRGCFVLKFSHSGQYLACACADAVLFPVKVFEMTSGNCIKKFTGTEYKGLLAHLDRSLCLGLRYCMVQR